MNEVEGLAKIAELGARSQGQETPAEQPKEQPSEQPVVEQVDEQQPEQQTEQEAKQEQPGEEDTPSLSTLAELAEYLGNDPAELYNLQIPVKDPDGNPTHVSLGEWKDGYQSRAVYDSLRADAEKHREAAKNEYTNLVNQTRKSLEQQKEYLKELENVLLSEYKSVDWARLETENPGQAALLRQRIQERRNGFAQARWSIDQRLDAVARDRDEREEAERLERIKREHRLVTSHWPEFGDPAKAEAQQAELSNYLLNQGFTEDDIVRRGDLKPVVLSHRDLLLYRKAMLYDKMQKSADAARKKVVKIGKPTLRGGAAGGDPSKQAYAAARAQLKKSGSDKDALAAIGILGRRTQK